jgi:hypothetical protein
VLVDTAALLAVASRTDAWHEQATALARQLRAEKRQWIITEWILAEFLGSAARPPLRATALQIVEQARASALTTIIPATTEDWQKGFALYAARVDKAWSLVDCISILLCERMGITEVFTSDHHFAQAGLTVLLV